MVALLNPLSRTLVKHEAAEVPAAVGLHATAWQPNMAAERHRVNLRKEIRAVVVRCSALLEVIVDCPDSSSSFLHVQRQRLITGRTGALVQCVKD